MTEQRRVELPKTTQLLASACNPCMDLIALLCLDSAPPLAAVGPPGLTPAQLAMRQKMLAFQARRLGVTNPAAGRQQQSGARRGPQIKLALWRSGAKSNQVWEVDVVLPKRLFPETDAKDFAETVRVAQVCWSPNGTYFGSHRRTTGCALVCDAHRRHVRARLGPAPLFRV